jgi:quinol-cytochrome oxidoreductase complex cytochrome b subunit
MRAIAMENGVQSAWLDGFRAQGLSRTLWRFGWGLLFVVVMTLLSVFGPRTQYSKVPPGTSVADGPAVRSVK